MRRVVVASLVVLAVVAGGCSRASQSTGSASAADQAIAGAYKSHGSAVEVQDVGVVTQIFSDDVHGQRYQRFNVRLGSGQTLLITHNVDIAPQVEPLNVGDTVEFHGEYSWDAQGGVVQWTHDDPAGRHEQGWLRRGDTFFQ